MTVAPPEVAANLPVVVAVVERLTVKAVPWVVVTLPKASSTLTVKALLAEELAAPLKAVDVMTSWVPAPTVMVSTWAPEFRPVAAAVMVGVPALVSP